MSMKVPPFTLVQLHYFAAAVDCGSMTAASRELMVSQSAVSTAIAQLEKALGVTLVLRHHAHGLALTAAGRAFHSELRAFLAHSQELADTAANAGQVLVGDLTVGCFATLAPFQLPRILARSREAHPAVSVHVLEAEHAELKRALRTGACEVALAYGYDLEEDLVPTHIGAAAPYALVPEHHRLAGRAAVALRDLVDDPMILLDLPHSADYFLSLFADRRLEPLVRHRSTGFETVRALVAAGEGFAVLNQKPSNDTTYTGQRVVTVPISDGIAPLDVVLVRLRGARATRKAEAFMRLCVETYQASEPGAEESSHHGGHHQIR
jgi:DNA-binding transcriptional LysR family regulator